MFLLTASGAGIAFLRVRVKPSAHFKLKLLQLEPSLDPSNNQPYTTQLIVTMASSQELPRYFLEAIAHNQIVVQGKLKLQRPPQGHILEQTGLILLSDPPKFDLESYIANYIGRYLLSRPICSCPILI
jgi:hypothetical protein